MENYQVLHMEKRVTISSGLNRHITRVEYVEVEDGPFKSHIEKKVWTPANADSGKTADNVELVSRIIAGSQGKIELSLQQAIDKRIQEVGIKPRVGQARSLEMILSGSPEIMNAMTREELLRWAKDSVDWAKKMWGEENVVSASLHVDEKTPHIHLIVVPIVKGQSRRTKNYHMNKGRKKKDFKTYKIDHDKLRLSADEVYNQRRLYTYHDSYYNEVGSKYGLSRGIKAEPGSRKTHKNSEEHNRELERQAAQTKALISELTAEYAEKKDLLDKVDSDLKSQKMEIASQQKTIEENKETIKEQENQKASTGIISDATDIQIIEKYKTIDELQAEIISLNRTIIDKNTEIKRLDANVKTRRAQLAANVDLEDVPKKGIMGGYNTEKVTAFIESVRLASLRQAMNSVPRDIEVDTDLRAEVERLRKVEDDYNDLINSPERLNQRLEYLRTDKKRRSITEVFKYILKKAVQILHFTVTHTKEGEDIFAKFVFEGETKQYAARLTPDERFMYTTKDYNSLQEAMDNINDQSWIKKKPLSEIRKIREKEDYIHKLSKSLSLMTGHEVMITDYIDDGVNTICFSQTQRRYLIINKTLDVWSTLDSRVNILPIPDNVLNTAKWTKEGNLKNLPTQGRGIKL